MNTDDRRQKRRELNRLHNEVRAGMFLATASGMIFGAACISLGGLAAWGLVGFFALAFLYGWHDHLQE